MAGRFMDWKCVAKTWIGRRVPARKIRKGQVVNGELRVVRIGAAGVDWIGVASSVEEW